MYRTKSVKLMPDDLNNPEKIERKQIENICDSISKLIQQCNKKELKVADLKWQPHYSTVFKHLKNQLETILSQDSSKTLEKLNNIPYLLSLKNNIFSLLNYFSKFVQDNASLIGTKDHHLRRTFFVKVVHFQFLCHEIDAFFTGGAFIPSKMKISKLPARNWWENNFGEAIFVNLDVFVAKFNETYPFVNQAEIFSFKSSINFTATNFITTFEFDLFTRLYSPWEMIQEAWRIIYTHPAYLHFSTYGDTKDILSRHLDRPGTYVFRVSCKDLGFWTIGYVKSSKDMGQIKVDKTNLIEALVEGQKKNIYLYPNGEYTNPDLSNINQYRKEIIVKNEDLQLYDCFEDFKECKICRELEKDLQLESCGHQICHACYKMLRKFDKKLCPFCNQRILSTTKIVNIKNSSIYIDINPSKKDKLSSDVLYADMSSNGTYDANQKDGDESVQMRTSSLLRSTACSIYSNTSDDFIPIELPTRALPVAAPAPPTRPTRERVYNVKDEEIKPEINYPPMQKNKTEDTLKGPSKDIGLFLPKYPDTSSSVADTGKRFNFMYCDINDNDDDYYSNAGKDEEFLAVTLGVQRNAPIVVEDESERDDIYCDPLEGSHRSLKDHNHVNNGLGKMDDDIYCNHTGNTEDDEDVYAFPKDDSHNKDFIVRNVPAIPIICDEMYSNNNDDNENDDTVSLTEHISECTNVKLGLNQIEPASKESKVKLDDDMYSNALDENNDAIKECLGIEDLFSNWSPEDVARAMRVARYDKILAIDILLEFVQAK